MSRKRIIAWIAGVFAATVLLLVLATFLVLRSSAFHNYVLAKVQQIATESIGSRVQIQSFDAHLSTLTFDLYGITIEGTQPNAAGPLAQADHMGIGIKILSVLRREWNLNSLSLDHPVVRIYVNRNGNSNIPTPPSSSGPQTNVFDLAVGHVVVNRGEVYFNDLQSPLNADLRNLHFQSTHGFTEGGHYYGTLAYSDGNLQFGSYNSLAHNLNASFDATRGALKLSPVTLSVGTSQIYVDAVVNDYSNPTIQTSYKANIVADDFQRALKNPEIPSGTIQLSGNAQYHPQANVPALASLTLDGQMSSGALRERSNVYRGEIRDISAHYSIANGNAAIRDLRASLLGGFVNANLDVRDLPGKMQSQLEATARGISVGDLQSLAAASSVHEVRLSGGTDATVKASWNGSMQNLVANVDARVQAKATPAETRNSNALESVPIDATIRGRYLGDSGQISVNHGYIKLQQTALNFNGTVSKHSSLQIVMNSTDLHELETVAAAFQTSPAPLGLYGTANFNGAITGSTAAPHLQGQLTASNLRLKNTEWRVLRANLDAQPSSVSIQNGDLEAAQTGHINFALQTSLEKWSFTKASQFTVHVSASKLSIADFAHLASSPIPATGTLDANITFHGTETSPYGQGIIVLSNAQIASEPVHAVTLSFEGTGNEVHGTLGARMPAGAANSRFTYYPQQQGYDVLLEIANLQLDKLHAVQAHAMDVHGVLNVNATGKGTLKDPALTFTAQIPRLRVQDQNISGITLNADIQKQVATIDLNSEAVNTGIQAHGTIGLTGDYPANLRLDTGTIPLQPLFAAYVPQAEEATGQAQVHATLRGPLKNKAAVKAHAEIPQLALDYQKFHLGIVKPIVIDFVNDVLAIQRSEIRGTDTDLEFQGEVPVRSAQPASLLLLGTVNLQILSAFEPDLRSSGLIRFDINTFGQRTNPNVQGKIQIENASVAMVGSPVGLTGANGVLTLGNKRLDITSFQGQVGGGNLTAKGGVVFRPTVQFDLAATGNGITVIYPQGVRSGSDVNLSLTGNMNSALLSGQVRLARLSFTPDFDLSTFAGEFNNQISTPPSAGFASNLRLQIALQSSTGLNLVSRTLSLQGGANLRIQGTAADPVILGRADVSGGDVIFLANRYVIQGGSIAFVNPARTEPIVNIAATTTINQYNINLRLEGPTDRLRTTYSSDPSLPPVDIINLLAFGQTTEAQAANANAGGSLGPESVLASGISSQIAGKIQRIVGISQLSIDPVLGPNQGTQGARVTIQQRVTSNLFVTFSSDVTSTQQQIIQVQYNINPRWTVSADRDQNGGFGFDARVHKSF